MLNAHVGLIIDVRKLPEVGQLVTLCVDEETRRAHARCGTRCHVVDAVSDTCRLHSSGHLLDAAMSLSGKTELEPSKVELMTSIECERSIV